MEDEREVLWRGGPEIIKGGAFPVGMDAVLLAYFAGKRAAASVCDLGCGAGIIALLLLWGSPRRTALGVEIDAAAAETARKNAAINGLSDRFSVLSADMRDHKSVAKAGSFDLVVSNPPYFPVGNGRASARSPEARGELSCTLKEVCAAAAYFTRFGGSFAMVHRPERLSEALCALSAVGLEPKRLRFAARNAFSPPSVFLIEARRGGRPGLSVEPTLLLKDEEGRDSAEARAIYHMDTEN